MSKELIRLTDCVMSYDDDIVLDHLNLYINDKNIKPLQIYLRDILVSFNTQLGSQAQSILSGNRVFVQSVQMAAIVVTMLPILCLYPFLQKYFVKGVMIGSVKE